MRHGSERRIATTRPARGARPARVAALGAALVLGAATASSAAGPRIEGPYVGGMVGGAQLQEFDITAGAVNGNVEPDIGFALGATGGFGFGNGLRGEAELGWRRFGAGDVTPAAAANAFSDDIDLVTGFANVLYDFDIGSQVIPYFGAGAGGAYASIGDLSDTTFAGQGIVGLDYMMSPEARVGISYRYMRAFGIEDTAGGVSMDEDLDTHSVMIGFSYAFNGGLSSSGSSGRAATRVSPTYQPVQQAQAGAAAPRTRVPPPPALPALTPPPPRAVTQAPVPPPGLQPPPARRLPAPPASSAARASAGGGPPANPTEMIRCRMNGRVQTVAAGFCFQMKGSMLDDN